MFGESLARSWWVLMLYGVISVLFGLSALVWPGTTVIALTWAFGIMALAEGITSILALFNRDVRISKALLFVYAVASIIFGLLGIFHPAVVASVLLVFLGAWLVVAGIYRILLAIRIRKHIKGEWMIALSGVLAIVLGVLFVGYPAAGLLTLAIWIGAAALIYGILQIVASLQLRKLSHLAV
ncbi:HdeD family acid-resistance protein [Dyella terrae]|nr:HdeD family acid-resistance protein [Dyella terrae]